MLRAFPFTIVTLVIYNIVIIFSGASVWDNVLFDLTLFSGQDWALRTGDLMVLAGLLVLLAEVLRATSIERKAITNHAISVVVLLIYVVEFVVVAEAGTSTFFILTLISLVDVLAGVVVTIRLATRDFSYEGRPGFPPHD
jgi:hypothetical protein